MPYTSSKSLGHRDRWPSMGFCLAGFAALLAVGGVRRIPDADFAAFFADLAHARPAAIDPHRGYLFEGLLGDGIAYALGMAGLPPQLSTYLWWTGGLVALAAAVAVLVRRGAATWAGIALVVLFTRLPDALAMWIGKTDTMLLAALALSVARGPVALLGFAVAPFFHPLISLFSAVGVLSVQVLDRGRISIASAAVAVTGCIVDLLIFRSAFPFFDGRADFLSNQAKILLANAIQWGVPSLLAGFALPAVTIAAVAGVTRGLPLWRWMPLLAWLAAAGAVSSFFVLDHTRCAGLMTFATALAYLAHRRFGDDGAVRPACGRLAIVALFVARLAVPHYDEHGPNTFNWAPLRHWTAPLGAPAGDAPSH